ncbi:MAG: glycosyltransferase family 2 protein [Candidatus Omnitrophota bacterium]
MKKRLSVKLTAVIIVKDEEYKVAKCLEGIKWADEVVVVDDMSSDRTMEICRSYGAKVVRHNSEGNFDRQRNIGIDNGSGEWILQLDADEVVGEKLREAIKQAIQDPGNYVAFRFRRRNYCLGHFMRYGGCYDPYHIKLFRKDRARYVGKNIHETLKIDGPIGTLDADIDHYNFPGVSAYVARQNAYSCVEAGVILGQKGRISQKEIKYNLTLRPLKIFWKNYVKKRGYKDGMQGLVFAIISAFRHFLIYAKVWERTVYKSTKQDQRR